MSSNIASFCKLLLIAFVITGAASAQRAVRPLEMRLKETQSSVQRLERELRAVRSELEQERTRNRERIGEVESSLKAAEARIADVGGQARDQIESVRTQTATQIAETGSAVNRSYWITGLVGLLLASAIGGLILFFRRRLWGHENATEEKIRRARTELEEQNIKLDEKLLELFDRRLGEEKPAQQTTGGTDEPDHSLALKVADEIVRIEKNLSFIGPEVRGRKQLAASVERIRDNFAAKGYEIVAMLGRPYDDGMKAVPTFRQDDSLDEGKRIITGVIKPQINFNGVMIQTAQIEVSQG